MNKKLSSPLMALLAPMLFLAGCAGMESLRHRPDTPHSMTYPFLAKNDRNGWWFARYQYHWPSEEKPSWYLDVLTANEIVKPALQGHRNDIHLWRFHRRASRDGAGHQLSFIFFAHSTSASKIFKTLDSQRTLGLLIASGDLIRVQYDEDRTAQKPNVQDTSDPHWPHDLQRAWPWFIMGVSETWLALTGQISGEIHGNFAALNAAELKAVYKEVNERVTEHWRDYGAHAFVHHLNALFGYEPFKVSPGTLVRF